MDGYYIIMIIHRVLWDIATDIITGISEKLTVITILGLFLSYFMKELKAVQRLRDFDKKESNKKFEEIFERQIELERKNIEAIVKQCDTNSRLADAINKLTERIEKLQR
ncbi:MAG: hypothetical protein ACTHJ0_10560 [Flavipsychrobacter sp.]